MSIAPDEDLLVTDVYAAYPHSNGFTPDGRLVVGDALRPALHIVDLMRGAKKTELIDLAHLVEDAIVWFDVALRAPLLVTARADHLLLVNVDDGRTRVLHRSTNGAALDGLVAISPDGSLVAAIEHHSTDHRLLLIEASTGRVEEKLRVPWLANHVQFSLHDPDWLGCAHEGPADLITDRVQAFHPLLAPTGRNLADQHALSADAARALQLGHERWMFHRDGAIVVAYGDGPEPRGLWEMPVGEPARLISAGPRDWHCGISRDGTLAVVDTTGPATLPGHGWNDAGDRSSVVVVDMASGKRTIVANTRFDAHPFHPHPAFTPDGRHIVHNHITADGRRGVALREVAE